MRQSVLIVGFLGLLMLPAVAQTNDCMWIGNQCMHQGQLILGPASTDNRPTHTLTGDSDLDRAISICDAHQTNHQYMEGPIWEYDISGCDAVRIAWSQSKSEKDRRAAEAKRKEDEERAFVAQFVKGLTK